MLKKHVINNITMDNSCICNITIFFSCFQNWKLIGTLLKGFKFCALIVESILMQFRAYFNFEIK